MKLSVVLMLGILSLLLTLMTYPALYPLVAALTWFALWRCSGR
ncbi:MAG: hypothetical protein NZ992_00595 [Candidatus Korarchaeum sp.]|nr:hypothetical protein [Candidatus Korarchaeum sp.]MDW8035234.1 hypothetical protein [Candidatus Korarchaeum sp.]